MFTACKRRAGAGKSENHADYDEFVTAVAFIAFYYYSKPEKAAKAAAETRVGLVASLLKWISQPKH